MNKEIDFRGPENTKSFLKSPPNLLTSVNSTCMFIYVIGKHVVCD